MVSSDLSITSGVLQVTKLGPVLFLAIINDALVDYKYRCKYVDDLSIAEFRRSREPSVFQSQFDQLVK